MRTAVLLVLIAAAIGGAQDRISSPDGKLYAVSEPGRKVDKGEERERFSIFTSDGKPVSVIHIWLTDPNGVSRIDIRGCESYGWIDSRRFYCEGSVNPSMGVYLWFDATTSQELGEAIGSRFTWSPDTTTLANFGNVPHFVEERDKSDSLVVGRTVWPAESPGNTEQHWFHSSLSWSRDSRFVAVIDHQRQIKKAFFLEMIDAKTGQRTEHRLQWPDEADEWFPDHDFHIEWGRQT